MADQSDLPSMDRELRIIAPVTGQGAGGMRCGLYGPGCRAKNDGGTWEDAGRKPAQRQERGKGLDFNTEERCGIWQRRPHGR